MDEVQGTIALPNTSEAMTPAPASRFSWSAWWVGDNNYATVQADHPPLISIKLLELRRKVGGLKAEKANGLSFKIKSAKVLMDKLREAIDDVGLVCFVVAQEGGNVDTERGTLAFVKATIRVGAPDGSYADFVGCGHGADGQDKAGGKASTYAWKDALVKGLCLPDADMDDTDDDEAPVKGGVQKRQAKVKNKGGSAEVETGKASLEAFKAEVEACQTKGELGELVKRARSELSESAKAVLNPIISRKNASLPK
jgi:hypothetical protein